MDQDLLVKEGHDLIKLYEASGMKLKASLWFYNQDVEDWRLWIVPNQKITDQHDFYRRAAEIINESNNIICNIDIAKIELIDQDHPVIKFLSGFFEVTGQSFVVLENTNLNNFFVPRAIILLYKHRV